MTGRHPVITADTVFGDIDLDETPITLPSGRVLDERAAAEYGAEVAARDGVRPAQVVRAALEEYVANHG